MLLADAAQVAEGKPNILGGGWDVCGPGPTPMAVAVVLVVPPSEARRKHTWSVVLVDQNGEPALLPAADGQKSTVAIHGEIQRIRDRKSPPPDEPVSLRFAINMTPLPLEPDSRYAWRLSIDNKTNKDWQISFRTRPATAQSS